MNVTTNRRKSTDTAEPQQQSQQQQHSHQQPVIAYVSCRQAASSVVVTPTSTSSHTSIEDQDQLVSSTSNECLLMPTEGEGEEINLELDSLIRSPAHISSSTVGYDVQTNAALSITDEVMPSTSENTSNIIATRSVAEPDATLKVLQNSINTSSTSGKILKCNETMVRNMKSQSTAEDCETSTKECDVQTASSFNKDSGENSSENHKIILKLSKSSAAGIGMESCLKSTDRKTSDNEDLRKVEPLKINLLGTHAHSPKITIKPVMKTLPQGDITGSSEECSSSAEDEVDLRRNTNAHEPHILPKLTIRAVNEECGTSVTSIVPKLTIKMNDSMAGSSTSSTNIAEEEIGTCGDNTIGNAHLIANSIALQANTTLPLPKLTIKTGSDGQSESIMMNVSPASSTSSSSISHCFSSSSFSSFSSNSSVNCLITTSCGLSATSTITQTVPKLTIKPVPKTPEKETINLVRNDSSTLTVLPKYTIKNSNLCTAEVASGGDILEESQTTAKLPKLTIKTGQEHAVIITQHNDNVGSPGIPKLTIKTKSLEGGAEPLSSIVSETVDNNEKIPKITIKTSATNTNDTPPVIPKLTINVSQLESNGGNDVVGGCSSSGSYTSSLKQTVPKLTITRQQTDKVVINHHQVSSNLDITAKEELESIMPKMTIKTQKKSLSVVQSSTPANFDRTDRVQMQMQEREEVKEVTNNERQVNIKSPKVVPKLTIKNLGSPKLKMMVVRDVVCNEQGREERHSNRTLSAPYTTNEIHSTRELEDFNNLIHVTNGGESNSSQEFCGFNDIQANHAILTNADGPQAIKEIRRNSDDMDIDEALQQQHDPQMFNNLAHFTEPSLNIANSSSCLISSTPDTTSVLPTRIIDTVDLTSSPSPSNSPNNFNYHEEACHATDRTLNPNPQSQINTSVTQPTTNILLECLQREPPALTCPYKSIVYDHHTQQQPQIVSSPVQPISLNTSSASFKYPQLAERLLVSGIINNNVLNQIEQPNLNFSSGCGNNNNIFTNHRTEVEGTSKVKTTEEILDSIEIFDSPEGSPTQTSINEQPKELKCNSDETTLHMRNLPNGLRYNHHLISKHSPRLDMVQYNNNKNNAVITSGYINKVNLKRTSTVANNLTDVSQLGMSPPKIHCMGNDGNIMAALTCLARVDNDSSVALTTQIPNNVLSHTGATNTIQSNLAVNHLKSDGQVRQEDTKIIKSVTGNSGPHQRSRKQRHEHLLPVPMDEIEPVQLHSTESTVELHTESLNGDRNMSTQIKRRGRPKKFSAADSRRTDARNNLEPNSSSPNTVSAAEQASKSRRVQLLRKRLAIDMVAAEQPINIINEQIEKVLTTQNTGERHNIGEGESEKHRAEQRTLRTPVRSSRRSNTPTQKYSFNIVGDSTVSLNNLIDQIPKNSTVSEVPQRIHQRTSDTSTVLTNFCSSTDTKLSSTICTNSLANMITTTTSIKSMNSLNTTTTSSMCMSAQIDLTMSSSSSSASNCSTTATTTVAEVATSLHLQNNTNTNSGEAIGSNMTGLNGSILSSNSNNSMLPPTTILSSSNPLPDVIFKPNDFSSIIVTQQLRSPLFPPPRSEISKDVRTNAEGHTQDLNDLKAPSNKEDSEKYLSTPVRGRSRGSGRGRGSNRGARGNRGHRLLHGAGGTGGGGCVINTNAIREGWNCSEKNQDLFRPSPQVFEEDTRMSADLNQNQSALIPHDLPTIRQQTEFLANEESQSSVVSNNSAMDPTAGPSNTASNTSSSTLAKKPKKKKMEVCVAEDTEISVAALAKYDWPPPKGCCPSKHRENFMIQEQVALYLGIKSFKRKYPDLARRQVDIEERNWLQEKGLVSEKMCDLGITAVLASDILDIMVTDFYDKYEEYMDYERQKHFREKDARNKAVGLHGPTKGIQAKDRAMLSASKWNSYLNKTRREERLNCLDLQTFIINKPVPHSAPIATLTNRTMTEAIVTAIKTVQLYQPPPLLQVHSTELNKSRDSYYPLTLVPGQFCEKYITYTAQQLKQLPLKTVLDHTAEWWPKLLSERHESTDTDSAAETAIDATTSQDRNKSYMERIRRRRSRRVRTKFCHKIVQSNHNNNNKNLKLPELVEDKMKSSTNNCTESGSISDNSGTDSDDSTASSSISSSSVTITESSDNDECYSMSKNNCGVCQGPQNSNLKNMPEFFIQCYTCRRKVHPSCVEMPYRMSLRVRNYNWQCADCKCCIKCKRHRDQNKMLFCEQCDRGYHIYCLNIKAVPDCRWSCERCSICMRCGSTKPEGLTVVQQNAEQILPSSEKQLKQIKHKKVKWINEYRIDHITKLREHYSMLCVPCGRAKSVKRVQTINNSSNCSASNSFASMAALNNSSAICNTYNSASNSNNNNDSNDNNNINPILHNTTTATAYSATVNTIPFHLANTTISNCLTNTTPTVIATATATATAITHANPNSNLNTNLNLNAITVSSKSINAAISSNEMALDSLYKIKQNANTSTTVKSTITATATAIANNKMTEVAAITTNSTNNILSTKQDTNCGAPPVVA